MSYYYKYNKYLDKLNNLIGSSQFEAKNHIGRKIQTYLSPQQVTPFLSTHKTSKYITQFPNSETCQTYNHDWKEYQKWCPHEATRVRLSDNKRDICCHKDWIKLELFNLIGNYGGYISINPKKITMEKLAHLLLDINQERCWFKTKFLGLIWSKKKAINISTGICTVGNNTVKRQDLDKILYNFGIDRDTKIQLVGDNE